MSTAAELLEALPRHFESVAPTLPAAERADSFASDLLRLSEEQRWSGVRSSSPALKQQLLAAARVLLDFAAAASREAATGIFPAALLAHFTAGVRAVASCALLACTVEDLDAQAAFAICAPCSMVFSTGSTMMASVAQMQPQEAIFQLCAVQLNAAVVAVSDLLQPAKQPRAAVAFANSTAKPPVLVAWLGELCKALLCCQDGIGSDARKAVSTSLVVLLHKLLTTEPYARHRGVIAASRGVQQAVADAVLAHGLGGLPAALQTPGSEESQRSLGAEALECLPVVLQHPTLVAAVGERLHTADAVAVMRRVTAAIETLPVLRPAGMPARTFMDAHSNALLLLNICCHQQIGRVRADGALMIDVEIGRGSSGGSGSGSSDHLQRTAWQLVALVPRLLATLRALADDPDGPTAFPGGVRLWRVGLEGACTNVAFALMLLAGLEGQSASAEQLASWAVAAAAGLRLQPLLLQLRSQFQRMLPRPGNSTGASNGAQRLSDRLMGRLWLNMPECELHASPQPPAASTEPLAQLAASLAELHSTACRLAHFTAGRGSGALAGTPLEASPIACWSDQLELLTEMFERLMSARLACSISTGDAGSSDPKGDDALCDLRGACAAHLHAVLALATVAAGAAGAARNTHWSAVLRQALAVAVQHCSLYIDSAWDCAVDAAFESVAEHAAQASSLWELASELLAPVAAAAELRPRVAAALARGPLPIGSLLGRLLRIAEQVARAENRSTFELASEPLDACEAIVATLAGLQVHDAPDSKTVGGIRATPEQFSEMQAALDALRKQWQQMRPDASLAERAAQLGQELRPAARLAQLFWECLQLPEAEAQRQLELSRAAATRSCAYLRCANVAGQGGPAAGQGVGSARCSACRAVWYCGTACSHADWRAGHKRVCKALAAEQQAAKAARAAAGQQQEAA